MHASAYRRGFVALAVFGGSLIPLAPARAETVMQQCGQQYQAAKAGNTLNGVTWNQFRVECAARLKASPAAASAPAASAPAVSPAAASAAAPANPLKPAPAVTAAPAAPVEATPAAPTTAPAATTAAGKPVSPGRAAEQVRIKACGAEWKANKATLVAATPGLKWPQYWHTCSARMKAAGQ